MFVRDGSEDTLREAVLKHNTRNIQMNMNDNSKYFQCSGAYQENRTEGKVVAAVSVPAYDMARLRPTQGIHDAVAVHLRKCGTPGRQEAQSHKVQQ